MTLAEQVLNIARWAPSGDNSQCWRFELLDDHQFIIYAHDTRNDIVYDLDGHSSHIAHGILLETIEIAASGFGYKVNITSYLSDEVLLKFKVKLIKDLAIDQSPLFSFIKSRTVQRRNMGTKMLTVKEKAKLESSLPQGFRVTWHETAKQKRSFAWLNFVNAKTRLTMKEAFEVHKNIIDWHQQFSETKIPEQALGIDWLTARLMQWLFKSWSRVQFFNQFFAGTYAPRLQLDFIPGIRCSSHFTISCNKSVINIADYIEAGRVVQRFWLTSESLNLGFQPSYTPLVFSRYLDKKIEFTQDQNVIENAIKSNQLFNELVRDPEKVVFMGRLGRSKPPKSRSTRLSLDTLILKK